MNWLYPANTKMYDVIGAFGEPRTYWPVSTKVEEGDTVFIYLSAPYKQIGFVCQVEAVGLTENAVFDKVRPFFKGEPKGSKKSKTFMKLKVLQRLELEKDSFLAYERLKVQGLTGMLMGPRKLENNPDLMKYILEVLP